MTDKRQKAAKVKCKRDESLTICEWSSFTDEHNTLPKSTRKNVKWNKFAFGTPSQPDLLYNIDLRHQYGISVAESQMFLLAKRPSVEKSEEKHLQFAG